MRAGDVDGRFLATFLAVAEEGTFAAAAEVAGVTQPAVSYRMAQLEEQIGTALFERAGRGLVLTPEGRELRDFCGRYLGELEELTARLAGRPRPGRDPVRISAVWGFGRHVLFPVLCSDVFRDLPLELLYATADEVFERVEHGDVDLGVVDRTRVSSSLHGRELCREELVMIAPSGESRPTPARVDALADVESLPFITWMECGHTFGAWFEHHVGGQPSRVRSVQHVQAVEEVVALVGLGRGLSVVPLDGAGEALDTGRVRVIHPDGPPCLNPVYAVSRAGAFVREEVEGLVEAVRARGTRRSR